MFGPMFPNTRIASASLGSAKRAAAQERKTPKTDFAQWTLHDSHQLPLTYVSKSVKEIEVLKASNQMLTVF
jgi:hypothetical protein